MKKIKNKNQVIVVPTTRKTVRKVPRSGSKKTKPSQTLSKPRSLRSKENTLAYYNCLIEQVANPLSEGIKITQMAHKCKCSKDEVAQVQAQHKQQIVQELAKNYLAFGESLGHYLHADIVGCAKELKK